MTPRQIIPALVAVAAAATLLAGCGGSDSNAGIPAEAHHRPCQAGIRGERQRGDDQRLQVRAPSLTVKPGAKVTVTNNDSTAHTATADDGNSFDTGPLDPGSSQTISVSKPGSYPYHCSIHPFMKATIVVG